MILIQDKSYHLAGEFLWFGVILHCEVYSRYTKTIRKRLLKDLGLIARSLSKPIYVFQGESHDPLKLKFILDLGFTYSHRLLAEEGWVDMYLLRPLDLSKGNSHGQSLLV